MPEPSGHDDDRRPDPDSSASAGEKIATAVEELLGIVVRFVRTFLVFSFTPARAGETLAQIRPPDKSGFLRPSAFLFIGATLFSFPLGAIRYFTESKFPAYVVEIGTKLGTGDFSFLALLIRAFPIILIASLSAAIAGALVRTGSRPVRDLFVYVYGLQGIFLLLLVLALPPLWKASRAMLHSDDYIILMFPILLLALMVQGYRAFRPILTATQPRRTARIALTALFPVLFIVPLPLGGYVGVVTGLIPDMANPEPAWKYRPAPVRVIQAQPVRLADKTARLELSVVIANRLDLPFVFVPSDVQIGLFVVPPDYPGFELLLQPHDERVMMHPEYFPRYSLGSSRATPRIPSGLETPVVILPGAASAITAHFAVECSPRYLPSKDRRDRDTFDRMAWTDLVTRGNWYVAVSVTDHTSGQVLLSEHYRVDLENQR